MRAFPWPNDYNYTINQHHTHTHTRIAQLLYTYTYSGHIHVFWTLTHTLDVCAYCTMGSHNFKGTTTGVLRVLQRMS